VIGRLFLLFTIVSAVELWLLITIGGFLGPTATMLMIIATGMAGATLAKREGARVLEAWKQTSLTGKMPKDGVTSSALVLVGGVLLITPGVLTDIVGMLLLVPGVRRPVAGKLQAALQKRLALPSAGQAMFMGMQGNAPGGDFIDVDAHEPDADAPSKDARS